MNVDTIVYHNVTLATLGAIQSAFGETFQIRRSDSIEEVAGLTEQGRVAMIVIGVEKIVEGGLDGVRLLISRRSAKYIPIVLIALHPNVEQEVSALEIGAADYFAAATALPVLSARLRAHLSGRTSKLECYVRELELQQKKNAKLNRALAILSGTNSAIVRLRERTALFTEAARVAFEGGEFGAVWIGIKDKNGRLQHLASEGSGTDKLGALGSSDLDDESLTTGVIQKCFKSARVEIRNNTSPIGIPDDVCVNAYECGFGSLAILPIKTWDQVDGVMILCAKEENAFDEEDAAFLFELSNDLSFALRNFEQQDRANYLYYYDVLTGLPNFSLFLDQLTHIIHAAYTQHMGAQVLVANLGHFKHVNEVWGRHVGDQVLEIIAQRLRSGLADQVSIARVAGDSFAIADLYADNADLTLMIDRVIEIIETPIQVEGKSLQMSARLGCATSPADGEESEVVFRNAEAALKQARLTGEQAVFYSPDLNENVGAQLELESMLRAALGTDQFVMHFQPKVDIETGKIVAAEALIRWQHPEKGMISPAEFIPLAEDTRLIIPIGKWVIDAVCAQQSVWKKEGVPIVPIALNLSALQFKSSDVLDDVMNALNTNDLAPYYIELELTETLVMQDAMAAEATMRALRAAGLHLSLDDFGTGYSSLAYLKRFPFSSVKIDRAFVTDITVNAGDAAIAKAIIGMGHSLQLKVIAEGVETAEQLNLLRESGCDQIQGFYFSRPVPAEKFGQMLREGKCIDATWARVQ